MHVVVIILHFFILSEAGSMTGPGIVNNSKDREHYRDFDRDLDTGIHAFYQTQWGDARSIFKDLQQKDQKDPRPFFFDAMLPFWQYYFAGESSEAAAEFMVKSEMAIQIAENRISTTPEDTTTLLMLGGLYGYRALIAAEEAQYRTALRNGINGFSYTRKLMNMEPDRPDALIGQGLFHYMVGSVPREVRWIVSLAGLRGNRETGLEMLEKAAGLNINTSTDAGMILVYLYHREEKYEEALRVVRTLVQRWPENLIFNYYNALLLEKTGNLHEAALVYAQISESSHQDLDYIAGSVSERLAGISTGIFP